MVPVHLVAVYLGLGVVEAEAEGVERLAVVHVAVGAARHVVAGKVGQLFGGAVPGHRQAAEAVVLSGQAGGNGLAHGLAAIPASHDGVALLLALVQRDGAAAAQQQHHGLALALQLVQLVALVLGQFDAGAVALVKTGGIHLQLLALQLGAEASGVHYHVGLGGAAHQGEVVGQPLADADGVAGGAVVVALGHEGVLGVRAGQVYFCLTLLQG